MSTFLDSPRLLKGGIALVDPYSGAMRLIIAQQHNPASPSLLGCPCKIRTLSNG
jgi:hypothetical protein